jgi:alpha-1,2-mannosyltransferase
VRLDARSSQRLFLILLGLVFAAVSIQYSVKVLTPRYDGYTQSALLRWSKQIQAMEDGENIHEKYNYPNPPVMAQILWPLSELAEANPLAGALVWYYLKVAMALACLAWCIRLVETPESPFPVWAKMLAVALSLRPILGDLTHGNINIFVLFLVTASLFAFSRRRDGLAGLILALAIAAKVTPALFVIYFLWKRAYRTLAGVGVGLGLFFFVVPSAIFALQSGSLAEGWQTNQESLMSWLRGMVFPYLFDNTVTSVHQNQSLPGLLTRLLTDSASFHEWRIDGYVPVASHHLADWSPVVVKRIVQVCQVAFLAAMVWLCRQSVHPAGPTEPRRGWRLSAEYSLILIGMLLFSERTWKHHCVTLLLPVAVVCYGIAAVPMTTRRRRGIIACLAFAMLAMLSTSTGFYGKQETPLNSPGKLAQVYGAYTIAFGCLLTGLGLLLRIRPMALPSTVGLQAPTAKQHATASWKPASSLWPAGPLLPRGPV